MTKRTIKRTRPYLCTVCGGNGKDPRLSVNPCLECKGTGILQIDELETWDEEEPVKKVFGKEPGARQIKGPFGRKTTVKPGGKW